jgi:hypothetical protein
VGPLVEMLKKQGEMDQEVYQTVGIAHIQKQGEAGQEDVG